MTITSQKVLITSDSYNGTTLIVLGEQLTHSWLRWWLYVSSFPKSSARAVKVCTKGSSTFDFLGAVVFWVIERGWT